MYSESLVAKMRVWYNARAREREKEREREREREREGEREHCERLTHVAFISDASRRVERER